MKTIKLTKEHIEKLSSCRKEKEAAEVGFRQACQLLNEARIKTKDKLAEIFPGVIVLDVSWHNETITVED